MLRPFVTSLSPLGVDNTMNPEHMDIVEHVKHNRSLKNTKIIETKSISNLFSMQFIIYLCTVFLYKVLYIIAKKNFNRLELSSALVCLQGAPVMFLALITSPLI